MQTLASKLGTKGLVTVLTADWSAPGLIDEPGAEVEGLPLLRLPPGAASLHTLPVGFHDYLEDGLD